MVGQSAVLAVIGGGNMGTALVQGLLRSGRQADSITVCEVSRERRNVLANMLGGVRVTDVVSACSEAVIAVKPADVDGAIRAATAAGATRLVSIAAGVRLAALQKSSGTAVRVIRAMPNTPATIGKGVTAFAASTGCSVADRTWANELLSSVGFTLEVDESMLDAFTGLVGSGPAYVFYVAEALREAAVAEGFDAETSAALVAKLLVGSAALLEHEPTKAAELRARVTSPNGTTAAGIAHLDEKHVRDALVDAVRAATRRSKQLGDA